MVNAGTASEVFSRVSGRSGQDGDRRNRPVAQVARELGINPGTLGNWVAAYRKAHLVVEEPLSVSERARLRELERENQELKMRNEFLGKAAAFFAQEYR
jgi:transposase-like protein